MKCLSLWQPWATLKAYDAKINETRSWPTKHRGPVAIHASSRWTRALRAIMRSRTFAQVFDGLGLSEIDLPLGKIIAVGELVDCIQVTPEYAASLSQQELDFGDYTPGRFAWVFGNVRILGEPIPFRAFQGLFSIKDPAVLAAISSQLEAAA